MSKAAINMFTSNLKEEFTDLCCVAINPGWVQTGMQLVQDSYETVSGRHYNKTMESPIQFHLPMSVI
jgi:NAD(P)-dependent dehydrogenase (short-subunit alcohol dehydrogenase family)